MTPAPVSTARSMAQLDFFQALLPDGSIGAGRIVPRLQCKTRRTRHIQVGQKRPEAAICCSILRPHRILYAIVSNVPDPFDVRVKRFRYGGGPGKQVESDAVHSRLEAVSGRMVKDNATRGKISKPLESRKLRGAGRLQWRAGRSGAWTLCQPVKPICGPGISKTPFNAVSAQ